MRIKNVAINGREENLKEEVGRIEMTLHTDKQTINKTSVMTAGRGVEQLE